MSSLQRQGPACGVCRRGLQSGDRVTVGQDELIHVTCRPTWSDLSDRTLELLGERSDEGYCHACLAAFLGVPYEEVRKAATGLRATRQVTLRVTSCFQCQKPRVTIRLAALRTPARPSASEEVCRKIVERLRGGGLPDLRRDPRAAGQAEVKVFTGRGTGKLCSACDALIQETDRSALEFASPPGRVTRFHQDCYRVWKEEARRLRRGGASGLR